jgi:peptidoglycan-N-acetylglucosamine deacetylase
MPPGAPAASDSDRVVGRQGLLPEECNLYLMYLVRTPALIKPLFRDLVWNIPAVDDAVYLTFDDGPIPQVTPWVLDMLAAHDARATFFCIGRNAQKEPGILQRIRDEGHAVGNHTWDHSNGWETPLFTYLRSVQRCQAITGTDLFRPPYGRITREQVLALKKRYQVVMWEVLSADFDQGTDGDTCLRNVTTNVRPGSIIVFHDSLKAWERLEYALPRVLKALRSGGMAMLPMPYAVRTSGSVTLIP